MGRTDIGISISKSRPVESYCIVLRAAHHHKLSARSGSPWRICFLITHATPAVLANPLNQNVLIIAGLLWTWSYTVLRSKIVRTRCYMRRLGWIAVRGRIVISTPRWMLWARPTTIMSTLRFYFPSPIPSATRPTRRKPDERGGCHPHPISECPAWATPARTLRAGDQSSLYPLGKHCTAAHPSAACTEPKHSR